MNKILLVVVALAAKAAANPLPADKGHVSEKPAQQTEPTNSTSNPCVPMDGSGYDEYWLSRRCYDLTTVSEKEKEEMYRICPNLKQQNQTFLPNKFNHDTPKQALDELEWLECILNADCHHQIQDFLCHIYFPPCIDDICSLIRMHPDSRILNPEPVYPCWSMCSQVKTNCESLFRLIPSNSKLAGFLQCEHYPKMQDAPCIPPTKWVGRKPERDNTIPCSRVSLASKCFEAQLTFHARNMSTTCGCEAYRQCQGLRATQHAYVCYIATCSGVQSAQL